MGAGGSFKTEAQRRAWSEWSAGGLLGPQGEGGKALGLNIRTARDIVDKQVTLRSPTPLFIPHPSPRTIHASIFAVQPSRFTLLPSPFPPLPPVLALARR